MKVNKAKSCVWFESAIDKNGKQKSVAKNEVTTSGRGVDHPFFNALSKFILSEDINTVKTEDDFNLLRSHLNDLPKMVYCST